MESKIRLFDKYFKNLGKNIVFILNGDTNAPEAQTALDFITDKGVFKGLEIVADMPSGQLYNAIRGYLDERKIRHEAHGRVSEDYLTRINDTKELYVFLSTIKYYNGLMEKTHSLNEEEKLNRWKKRLETLASRYK